MPSVSKILTSVLLADDTTLVKSDKNLQRLVETFNEELKHIVNWLNANRLSLNIDKTNFMIFRPKNKNELPPDITINGSKITEVNKAKFLGVIIDNKLTWNNHIKLITQKISKGIGIMIKARKYFNTITLTNLYNTLILPYISYGIQVWGSAANTHIDKILIKQKKIVRIICGDPPRTHTKPLFLKLNLMTVYQIYRYYVGVFMYKLYHNKLPIIFDMFELTSSVHAYPTRQSQSYYIQFVPSLRTQKSIRISGPKIWNCIVQKITINCKISSYKINLKKLIIAETL